MGSGDIACQQLLMSPCRSRRSLPQGAQAGYNERRFCRRMQQKQSSLSNFTGSPTSSNQKKPATFKHAIGGPLPEPTLIQVCRGVTVISARRPPQLNKDENRGWRSLAMLFYISLLAGAITSISIRKSKTRIGTTHTDISFFATTMGQRCKLSARTPPGRFSTPPTVQNISSANRMPQGNSRYTWALPAIPINHRIKLTPPRSCRTCPAGSVAN